MVKMRNVFLLLLFVVFNSIFVLEVKAQERDLNDLLSIIAIETSEEREARLRREYPIDWFAERYGSFKECEGAAPKPDPCHIPYDDEYTEDEIKALIIYAATGINDSGGNGMRFGNIGSYYITQILLTPEKYSTDLRSFIYNPDILISIIKAEKYNEDYIRQLSWGRWYKTYNAKK